MANKFKISEFESCFSAQTLEEGLDLSQRSNDWAVLEEKGRLSATFAVKGLKPVHPVINKTNQYVLNYTCDCVHFGENRGCKHITGLLYLGHVRTIRLKPINDSKKFGFDDLIEVINKEELNSFLKFYSSNNLVFNKLFKQYFSYKFIPYGQSFSDYLNQVVQSHMDVSGQYLVKSKKQICQILELHLFRSDNLMLNHDWAGALTIISGVLLKIYQLGFDEPAKNIEYIIEKSHNNLMAIATQSIAPLLKRKIAKLATDLLAFNNYNYFESDNAVILGYMTLEGDHETIQSVIEEKFISSDINKRAQWLLQLYIFQTSAKNFNLIEFYSNYLDQDDNLIGFLELAEAMGIQDSQIDRILEIKIIKLNSDSSPELLHKLASYLINANKEVLYSQLCDFVFAKTMDEGSLNSAILFSVAIEKMKFAKQISNSKHFKKIKAGENNVIYAKLLFNAGKYKELLVFFEKFGTIDTLLPMLEDLLASHPEEGLNVLKLKLADYLDVHVGNQSSVIVEDVLRLLSRSKFYDEANEIVNFIKENYLSRKHLIKNLKNISI